MREPMGEPYELVLAHYGRPEVLEEIARFSRGRWVAIHCEARDEKGRPILVRYAGGRPLSVRGPGDVRELLGRLRRLRPRTFYASSAIYRRLEGPGDLHPSNALAFTPTWDVDNELRYWEATVEAAKAIVSFLEGAGVVSSVFVKWSGRGAHVHLHHGSISRDLLPKHGPLDVAYAIVEYVLLKVEGALHDIRERFGSGHLKVENRMDPQRVFTCPLTLHRQLDMVAVCLRPDELDDFTPDWARPGSFRHWRGWDRYEPGEADELALRALEVVGPYPRPYRPRRRKTKRVEEMIMRFLRGSPSGP
ncbi:hypothetical protein DRO32_04015 [Candidatus Bathyarchaeota archaeon]|nr:MAG: hypothetical protein DRO32_04015 [Candidatus Bathyarchaeota archaeon]